MKKYETTFRMKAILLITLKNVMTSHVIHKVALNFEMTF